MVKKLFLVLFSLCAFSLVFLNQSAYALIFTIEAPGGTYVRGEEYDFTVTINTMGEAISTTSSTVTYDTQYLELVSVTNGNFFDSITHTTPTTGTVNIVGTSATAKTGSGNFAIVRFKLIAGTAGSTELCTVAPDTTPTTVPLLQCGSTCTTSSECTSGMSCIENLCLNPSCPSEPDCICAQPTSAPVPTALPKTGMARGWQIGSVVAFAFVGLGILGIILL